LTHSAFSFKQKGKVKVRPRTGHEDPEGENKYSSTLSSATVLDNRFVKAIRISWVGHVERMEDSRKPKRVMR
jgi:hypothetical protein